MATLTRRRQPAPPVRPTLAALHPDAQAPGRTITVGAYIVEQIHAGVDPNTAAGCTGVTPAELQGWVRTGVLGFERLNAGEDWRKAFTPDEQECVLFAEQLIRARSVHVSRLEQTAQRLAAGEYTRVRTTTRRRAVTDMADAEAGELVETTTVTEPVLPDAEMVRWLLEHAAPDVFGKRARLDVTVQDLTDTDVVEDVVERRMREVAAALMDAIETTGTEAP